MCNQKSVFLLSVLLLFGYTCFAVAQTSADEQAVRGNRPDTNSVWKLSLHNYVHRVDSVPATITGGCVSLTSGTLATSLLLMAMDVSGKNEKNELRKKKIDSLSLQLRTKRDSLEIFADLDNLIFQRFLAAYKLPHATAADKKKKDSIIYATLNEATSSPLKAAKLIQRILYLANQAVGLSAPNVASDVRASSVLLNASFDAIVIIADDDIGQLRPRESKPFQLSRDQIVKQEKILFNHIMRKPN
jgi:formiminotetrahydrofolate cyclodeaminase